MAGSTAGGSSGSGARCAAQRRLQPTGRLLPALSPSVPHPGPQPRPSLLCAEDADLQRVCELQQRQFLLACEIHDLERGRGDQRPLGLLPKLRDSLAGVTAKLSEQQQPPQQQQPVPSAGEGSGC